MTKSKDRINQFIEQARQMRLKFEAEGKQLITDALADMFAEHRNLRLVEWTQYTPYFNDGEACEFSVNTPDFHVSDQLALEKNERERQAHEERQEEIRNLSEEQRRVLGLELEEWTAEPEPVESFYAASWRADESRKKYGAELYDAATAFNELITSGELEHVLQGAFGDHVKITATRDGIDVEEYEHD